MNQATEVHPGILALRSWTQEGQMCKVILAARQIQGYPELHEVLSKKQNEKLPGP